MHLIYEASSVLYYIFTLGATIREWNILINTIDLIGKHIAYVLDIYILHTFEQL